MESKLISIAENFSKFPAGRYKSDGPFSGQHFRDDILYPALRKYERVIVNIDGTMGYGSSFLEEAFGGLRREYNLSLNEIREKLEIQGEIDTYIKRIWQYIESAK